MKTFTISALISAIFLLPLTGLAQTDSSPQKLRMIQDMYRTAVQNDSGAYDLFPKHASPSFKQALALQDKVSEAGYICGSGADDMWVAQDYDVNTPLNFRVDKQGLIEVKIGANDSEDRRIATYQLDCVSGQCLIEDVYTTFEDYPPMSVKKNILEDCS